MKEWSKKCPTKPGFYWFFGWPYNEEKAEGRKPELNSIHVTKISNGNMVTRSGAFWFPSEMGEGLFIEAELPTLPNVLALADGTQVLTTHMVPEGGRNGFFHSEELIESAKRLTGWEDYKI